MRKSVKGKKSKYSSGAENSGSRTRPKIKGATRRLTAATKPTKEEVNEREWVKTGIPGFDELFDKGIPRGKNILVAGGPGTGKTIFCLQTLHNATCEGHDCLYITFEETPSNLIKHLNEFGYNIRTVEEDGNMWNLAVRGDKNRGQCMIIKQDPFKIARSVEALLAKAAGHLRIDAKEIPELIPKTIKPYMIALDSITALESAFVGKPESYRIYIEQLFRLFEETGATTFLITETEEAPIRYSKTGVEEFLADGVFVLYYLKFKDTRERAIEVLKLRGTKHERKIVPFIIGESGIEVFPDERIYEAEW